MNATSERDSLMSNRRAYVAEFLRARAKDAGVSQAMLAERLEVTPGRVSQILSGDENLTVDTMTAVLAAVGVTFALAAADEAERRDNMQRLLTQRTREVVAAENHVQALLERFDHPLTVGEAADETPSDDRNTVDEYVLVGWVNQTWQFIAMWNLRETFPDTDIWQPVFTPRPVSSEDVHREAAE